MEKQIITGPLDIEQRIDLKKYMYNCIRDSMEKNNLDVSWYESCSMRSFFRELTEIRDEDGNRIGDGLETSEYKFVLNDKTISCFRTAFSCAREKAIGEMRNNEISPLVWMGPLLANFGGN